MSLAIIVFLQVQGDSLQLQDAVSSAVKLNPALAVAGASIEVAQGGVTAAEGLDDLVLDVGVTWTRDPALELFSTQIDLTKPIGATGGSIGMRSRTDSLGWSQSLQLVINQPILRGAGRVARAPQRRAREGLDLALAQREALAASVVRDVVTAYWELAYAREELDIRVKLAAGARDQLARVQANIDAGKLPSSASAEVLVAAGLRDEEAVIAERFVLERSLELRRLAGLPIGLGKTALRPTQALAADDVAILGLAAAIAAAHAGNPQLVALRSQARVAAVDLEVTENGVLPQLDLAVFGGPFGAGPAFTDAAEAAVKLEGFTVGASLTFRHAFGNHAARGARASARGAVKRVKLDAADVRAQVTETVVNLVALAEEARRRIAIISSIEQAAALDLDAEKARFEVGRATNFDVLRRQQEVAQTRLRQARARVDLLRATAALQAVTGDILARYGVRVR